MEPQAVNSWSPVKGSRQSVKNAPSDVVDNATAYGRGATAPMPVPTVPESNRSNLTSSGGSEIPVTRPATAMRSS